MAPPAPIVIRVTVESAEPFRGAAGLEPRSSPAARFESWLEFLRVVSELLRGGPET